jgi:hypothetical protein
MTTDTSNNIVIFPLFNTRTAPPHTFEEMMEVVSSSRKEHIEYLIDETLSFVFSRCAEDGFDLGQDKCSKTTAMLIESLRAALFNTVGLEHPLHKVADTMFQVIDDSSGGSISIIPPPFVADGSGELVDRD